MRLLCALALTAFLAGTAQEEPKERTDAPQLSGRDLINHLIEAKWAEAGLKSAGTAEESEFLRRVYLDIVGTIPSLEGVEEHFKRTGSDRRTKLVDELLSDPRYAENWSQVWAGLLVGYDDQNFGGVARLAVGRALQPLLARNEPYDAMVRTILTASGQLGNLRAMFRGMMEREDDEAPAGTDGLVAFYLRMQRQAQREMPQALAGKFSRIFLGTQIQCAQCHDHPFAQWTQEDFYGMAAFFTQVNVQRRGKDADETFIVDDRPRGRRREGLMIPDSKKAPIPPSFMETGEKPRSGETLRAEFARMLTSRDNLQFARTAVNRMWSQFMGRGIVHPPDGFDRKNPPTHPDLLDALARDFINHGFDVRWLIREIALSKPYQLTSKLRKRTPEMEKYFAVASVRALTPEQIMKSLITAATVSGEATTLLRPRELIGVFRDFRYAFGDDEGAEVTEFQGTIPAALLMMNSRVIQMAVSASMRGGRLKQIVDSYGDAESRVRAMFAAALARQPSNYEVARYVPLAAKGSSGCEDVYWTLLNSSDFLFNK